MPFSYNQGIHTFYQTQSDVLKSGPVAYSNRSNVSKRFNTTNNEGGVVRSRNFRQPR